MCGIIGAFGKYDDGEFFTHVASVEDTLARRGPDQRNSIKVDNYSGVHSRLIIQGDNNDGIQPFVFQNIIVLFNGNLYNKDSLRRELIGFGYKFQGVSDTEVVALAIHKWGTRAFIKFNGFFAIATLDKSKNILTLSRDKYGQKPLYYSCSEEYVYFGSTEETIPQRHVGKIRKESYIDFITYGFVPAPNTMFEKLKLLEPSSYISFKYHNNLITKVAECNYWLPRIRNEIGNADEAYEALTFEIESSIAEGMQADTPVSCLYSGGIDSSLLFSYARDVNPQICAITADFGDGDDAKKRALPLIHAYQHDNHVIKNITKDAVAGSLGKIHEICRTPFDDTSVIPCNLVFSKAKEEGYSVAITGDGADELFCGYQSFSYLNRLKPILNKRFNGIRNLSKLGLSRSISKYKGRDLTRIFLGEEELLIDLTCNGFKLSEQLASGYNMNSDYDPTHYVKKLLDNYEDLDVVGKFRLLNLMFKLPNQMLYKVDRASMFNSVEARPIFLNDRIVDCALSMGSHLMLRNGTKGVLKEICRARLPTKEWNLPKTGFGWKTKNYKHVFTREDDVFLNKTVGVPGMKLLDSRMANHKRGYYGLHSLTSWVKNNL